MIHLAVESAALFAQVLPVLTLVMLLEGRVPIKKHKSGMVALVIELFRFVSMLYGMTGTVICLWIVASKKEPNPPMDVLITLGFWIISIGIVLFGVLICWSPIKQSAVRAWPEMLSEMKTIWNWKREDKKRQ